MSVDGGASWVDADGAPGPRLLAGESVGYRVSITNTGTIAPSDLVLECEGVDIGACGLPDEILEGELVSCTETVGWSVGSNGVTATVSAVATDARGVTATVGDSDEAWYTGAVPALTAELAVSPDGGLTWFEADEPPGPPIGEDVGPRYALTVTNAGNVDLKTVALGAEGFDLSGCPPLVPLGAGEQYACEVGGEWSAGQNSAAVTATVTFEDGAGATAQVEAVDRAYTFGTAPGIEVEKGVSADGVVWHDADDEDGALELAAGAEVWWGVRIWNTGTVSLRLTVEDVRDGGVLDLADVCETAPPEVLEAGQVYRCEFVDPEGARQGVWRNVVTVEGRFGEGWVGADVDATVYVVGAWKVYLPLVMR